MPVAVWAGGKAEEYSVSVPAYTGKEDLQQMIEDGMQVRNRNYDQLVEFVCLQPSYNVLVLFLGRCPILNILFCRQLLPFRIGRWRLKKALRR